MLGGHLVFDAAHAHWPWVGSSRICAAGWDKKPGVRIVFGRWQDVLPQLGTYDGIFFDTCAAINRLQHCLRHCTMYSAW